MLTHGYHVFIVVCVTMVVGKHPKRYDHKITVTGSKRTIKGREESLLAFQDTVVRQILESSHEILLSPKHTDSAFSWLHYFLESKQWTSMEEKMSKDEEEFNIDDPNLREVEEDFGRIIQMMKEKGNSSNSLKMKDLEVIRRAWSHFFPQGYQDVNFSVKWMNVVCKYLVILTAAYIDVMQAGDIEECKLSEQLNVLKSAIINAAKTMAMSRYKKLGKMSWNGGTKKYNTGATLTFWDSVTGKWYRDVPLSQVQGRILIPMKLEMGDLMMKRMAEKYHALYNQSWAGSSCNLEEPITLDDLEFSFPSSCMDGENICILPCGYYQEQKPWCVTKFKNNVWAMGKQKLWDPCEMPDWSICSNLKNETPVPWEKLQQDNVDNEGSRKHEVLTTAGDGEVTSKTPDISSTTVLISDGINAIMSLVCADKCNGGEVLTDNEKKQLNEIISGKVKDFLALHQNDKDDNSYASSSSNGLLDDGLSRVVEALIVKAVLDKKKSGSIAPYLDGLQNWEITSEYIKEIKSKITEINGKPLPQDTMGRFVLNVEVVSS